MKTTTSFKQEDKIQMQGISISTRINEVNNKKISSTRRSRREINVITSKKNAFKQRNFSNAKMATANSNSFILNYLIFITLITLTSTINITSVTSQIVLLDNITANQSSTTTTSPSSSNYKLPPSSTSNQQQQIFASFATPNQAINITHVTYDPLYDTIYLGATNAIYQLNGSDLSEQFESTTGPVFDNPSCGITECNGYEDFIKPTQNVNKILVIDYQHKKLLSCGSTKQGACRRYQLNNISQKEDLISMAVAANDDNSSTYAFIAPARYTYDPSSTSPSTTSTITNATSQQQRVLYVATTYTKFGQSRDLQVPAIGTRTLDDGPNLLKLYENSFLDSARIDINSHLRDYFLVNYLYGFASSNYIYFVTVQKKATSRDYEELGYHTRLARICITDSSYNSYTEVDLKCIPNKKKAIKHQSFSKNQDQQQYPTEYPLLQDAILVDAGSQLLQSIAQSEQSSSNGANDFLFNSPPSGSSTPDDNKVLLAVFSSAKDNTQSAGDHSALCAFSLSQIEEKFNDNIHNCYTGKMQSRNMEYIAGNVQDCPKSGQGGNVVNFCHETLKINGTIPIVSEASIQFINTTLTAITATSSINTNSKNIYNDQLAYEISSFNHSSRISSTIQSQYVNQNTVAFLGTSNGHIKKVLLNNASNGFEFEDLQVDTNPILSDLHLHSSGQQLIVATPYKVMKVATHNCAQYSTCRECSQSKNPYCGWCSLKRSCTTKNECVPSWNNENSNQISSNNNSTTNTRNGQLTANNSQLDRHQLKWISNDSSNGKCIDLQSIVPDRIPLTSTGKVDLYIDRLLRMPKEQSYKCVFDKKDQTIASTTSFGLTCPLPKVMHRPKIQAGKDHAMVDLAVRSSETNTDFLNGKITFFDCQLHTTCKDCLTTNWGCNWCMNENICLFNTSKCEKGTQVMAPKQELLIQQQPMQLSQNLAAGSSRIQASSAASSIININNNQPKLSGLQQQRVGNTINLVSQCPSFDLVNKQEILIADGSERELTIKVKNMPQFKGSINCIVEIENDKVSLKAKIDEDRVICENSTYSYSDDVGLVKGQLAVIYSDNNIFIDKTDFTLYKCRFLGSYSSSRPDCSLCQRIDPRFNCVWCGGSCHHKSRCNDNNNNNAGDDNICPPPRIDYLPGQQQPGLISGLSQQQQQQATFGGTRFTIGNLGGGQSYDDLATRISLGNVPYKPLDDDAYQQFLPASTRTPTSSESSSISQRLGNYFTSLLLFIFYLMAAIALGGLVYTSAYRIYNLKQQNYYQHQYQKMQSKMDSLEKSIKSECRLASMALQGDLNELVRHVDLTGIPILSVKSFIMKVFFPGINNHPLLIKSASNAIEITNNIVDEHTLSSRQHAVPHPLKFKQLPQQPTEFPMEYFEKLILTKPFLIVFINTLEAQSSFTIRDRVNVASLIMIILMQRLDYATDVLKTLLFQLVQRTVGSGRQSSIDSAEFSSGKGFGGGSSERRLSRRASNLLGGISGLGKRSGGQLRVKGSNLGKVVGGSASSLMASTTVAAQMLLSRVGNKTSPLQSNNNYHAHQDNLLSGFFQQQHQQPSQLIADNNIITPPMNHCMSTTTFNQRSTLINTIDGANSSRLSHTMTSANALRGVAAANGNNNNNNNRLSGSMTTGRDSKLSAATSLGLSPSSSNSIHLMLRKTDSVVEKMLTNWLALNMYDYFHGDVGHSLYMLFEAIRSQLDRGPIDSVSGDAYYSINEHKLLHEPQIQFEAVNLYIIVETSILKPVNTADSMSATNLLLDATSTTNINNSTSNGTMSFYDENGIGNYTSNNTITLTVRVLDCDTISQVKGKILNALYRNSPYSQRLSVDQVELSLRQPSSSVVGSMMNSSGQYITATLADEDYSSESTFNGSKRVNTLRHYGITDQAIMMLNRICGSSVVGGANTAPAAPNRRELSSTSNRFNNPIQNRTTLTDMLDEHYNTNTSSNNHYSEIQYGQTTTTTSGIHMLPSHNLPPLPPPPPPPPLPAQLQTAAGQQTLPGHNHQHQHRHQSWHLVRTDLGCDGNLSNNSSPPSNSPSMLLLGGANDTSTRKFNNSSAQANKQQQQQQYYHPSSSSTSSSGNVMDTNSTSANSTSAALNVRNLLMKQQHHRNYQQPIYCQIGSNTIKSQHCASGSAYYCQVNPVSSNANTGAGQNSLDCDHHRGQQIRSASDYERERQIYLTRMLTSKGTVQNYIDDFFRTILSVKSQTGVNYENNNNNFSNLVLCANLNSTHTNRRGANGKPTGACPPAVKWLFDLLDEAAMENGITDHDVIHSWKSNAFLLRFWANFIKNPNYILDVEKSQTLDASLSVIAQTLMDSCSTESELKPIKGPTCNKMLFVKDIAKYKSQVKRFYQDIATMKPVSDQEIVNHMGSLSMADSGRFDTNLALKELCVYAVNYGVELMSALNNDYTCQQMDLSQQLEQCFRSFTIFEAYR